MRYIYSIATLIITLLAVTSCIKEPTIDYNELEQRSLKAWIAQHRPNLIDNYQEEGGYYVEVLNNGCLDSTAVTGKDVWVWYNFTSRSLSGNILETRSADVATQLNTFNKHTRYVPAFRFSGKDSHTLMEGTYLATFNKLKIGDSEFEVRYGTMLRLYLPSAVLDSDVATNDGGYEGEFSIDSSKPMIVDMTIYGHVGNPVAYEGERVTSFANANGGACDEHAAEIETDKNTSQHRRTTRAENEEENENEEVDKRPLEFFDGRWHQPVDTMKHLLVNYAYSPKQTTFDFKNALGLDTLKYPNETLYTAEGIYANGQMSDVDRRINEALVKRFGKGIEGEEEILEADSVKTKSTAKVWYIGRFLDGFIFDTNIDEVNEILYGVVENEGEALSFETKDPKEDNDYILAWEYSIPTLRLGQWAAILTVSTYGYGIAGKVGSHTSTTITDGTYDYANYYNYMNYMNNYYGGYGYGGYGNMYNQGYYGYNPYYYGYTPQVTTATVTTTSTEIPAFSPLLFQVFVEK